MHDSQHENKNDTIIKSQWGTKTIITYLAASIKKYIKLFIQKMTYANHV